MNIRAYSTECFDNAPLWPDLAWYCCIPSTGKDANLASTLGVSAVNVGVALGAAVGGMAISILHSPSNIPLSTAIVCAVGLPVSVFAGKRFWRNLPDPPVAAVQESA